MNLFWFSNEFFLMKLLSCLPTVLAQVHFSHLPDIVINQWMRMRRLLLLPWFVLMKSCSDEVKILSSFACTGASHPPAWHFDQSMQWKRMILFLMIKNVVTFGFDLFWRSCYNLFGCRCYFCFDDVVWIMILSCACTGASHPPAWHCNKSMKNGEIIFDDKDCYFCFDLLGWSCYFFDEVGLWFVLCLHRCFSSSCLTLW